MEAHHSCAGFNTQPPEGGWPCIKPARPCVKSFNTQPPEGGWARPVVRFKPKWSFNTQPPEGGWAALRLPTCIFLRFQHTAARRRLAAKDRLKSVYIEFQHTAARRRLGAVVLARRIQWPVSTHSRPKAAGYREENAINQIKRFNTQPPEGGWHNLFWLSHLFCRFNTQPPEGGWSSSEPR